MIYEINKKESARITYMRAICVLMVIVVHQYAGNTDVANATGSLPSGQVLSGLQYIISRIITFCAVPLFFLMSSVLLYAKPFTWAGNMKKKLRSLVLPYFLWISLYLLLYFLGQTIPFTRQYFMNADRMVQNMDFLDFVGAYLGYIRGGLFVNAMWFLRDLIILNMLAPAIKWVVDKVPGITLCALVLLWNLGGSPVSFILNSQSIVFFTLGYYVVKYNVRMSAADRMPWTSLVIVYLASIALEFVFYLGENPLRIAAHSFSSIAGILLVVKLSGTVKSGKVIALLKTIAKYSFFVYVSHDFVQTILKKLLDKLLTPTDAVQCVTYILIPVLTVLFCICVGAIINKLLPPLYRFLTGARIKKQA